MRKEKHYWKDLENVKKEIIPICDKLGRLPSHKELKKLGLSSLARYIAKYHGGFYNLAKILKLKTYDDS